MVNDLRGLLNDTVASPPHDDLDLAEVLGTGRRRVRLRRAFAAGGAALATAAVALGGALVLGSDAPDLDAAGVPRPAGPTLRLSDAVLATEGSDYRMLVSHTNGNLDEDNGQYFDGVTDDGLILFRDGPRMNQPWPRFALMDPTTGEKDWLPDLEVGQSQTWPLELGEDRLALLGIADAGMTVRLVVHVLDRESRQWESMEWPELPAVDGPSSAVLGPDDRIYVRVPETQGKPPRGGWPTGPDGEADDADADGDTYRLWSASMTDELDVRDEDLTVGAVAFTEDAMVWTDSTNGDSGLVHVRDLRTGQEHAFDAEAGERCNLLSFGAAGEHIVMGQYCGTYDDGVRDDRVQVVDTDGDQVVTLQGSDLEGGLISDEGEGLITVLAWGPDQEGTYVYDLAADRFLRISDDTSSWTTSGPTPAGQFLWNTPENRGRGMTQYLGQIED